MLLEIIATTDGRYIGATFDPAARPIHLAIDRDFTPDRVWQIAPGVWRLANSNYVIDAKE
jgi:hypothetical protein